MKTFDAATAAALAARAGIVSHRAIWITARNRATDKFETFGIWSGEDDLTVTIEGEARTYLGAGRVLDPDPITAGPGLNVRIFQVRLAAVDPKVEDLVKGYDTRFAPAQMHRVMLDPQSRKVIGQPFRLFRGMVNDVTFPREAPGGDAAAKIELVSETRVLTRTLAQKKSDESQRARDPSDKLRQYGDISGAVPVYWGELRIEAPADPAPSGSSESKPQTDDWGNIIYKGK